MEKIREYRERIAPLSDKDWQIFSSKLTKRQFPKKALLLKAGQTENYLSFMEQGIVRYYIPKTIMTSPLLLVLTIALSVLMIHFYQESHLPIKFKRLPQLPCGV